VQKRKIASPTKEKTKIYKEKPPKGSKKGLENIDQMNRGGLSQKKKEKKKEIR